MCADSIATREYDNGAMSDLRGALATEDAKAGYVRRLFHTIAGRYDLITRLLSYGQDQRWKGHLVDMAQPRAGLRALDLASGTGDIALALAARGGRVTALDLTHRMLQLARAKPGAETVHFVTGDMMALPFPPASFALVTIGYGIRNVPRIETTVAEIHRVLEPGGVLLSLDFNRPANRLIRGVYLAYLTVVGSALGWFLHRDPDTYRYIPESIRRYPGADGVARLLARAGFDACRVVPLLGGLMAINVARKPREVPSPHGSV
jgi:demethylmenaquinone methyltransferase/2-methoxy-6-polyprenyl-1,4-benzoquinol methylase